MNFFLKAFLWCSIVLLFPLQILSQQNYQVRRYTYAKVAEVYPRQIKVDWLFEIQNLESPFEGNSFEQLYIDSIKAKIETRSNSKEYIPTYKQLKPYYSVTVPKIIKSFEGNHYSSSVPNDNSMAVSNEGMLVSAINTNIIFYNTQNDSLLKTISLRAFSDTLSSVSSQQYDPKVIYDYQADRFIVVFLAGAGTSANTNVIIAFSSSSNPMDPWNLYSLPGNPLNDTSWSDYPAISLSNKDLFVTLNLLKKGSGSWQTSFKQSIIWQIDKDKGYYGDSLVLALYSDISFRAKAIRNIHPVRGGNTFYGPNMYFLSERNFALQSDTFFLIQTYNNLSSNSLNLSVNSVLADCNCGMPPNAKQTNNKALATNDSRVLGAFFQNDYIQFVGNTVDTLTGHASFYHGTFNPKQRNRKIHLNILTDTLLEFAYPAISYCGTNSSSKHSIISFDYTARTVFAGMGAIFYEDKDLYSKPLVLKKGDTPIQVLFYLQRWGDYSASQPRYNHPGEVWTAGTYGKRVGNFRLYGTWIAAILNTVEEEPTLVDGQDISSSVYPNPMNDDQVKVDFVLPEDELIEVEIVDATAKRVALIFKGEAKKGRNILSFSSQALAQGIYFLLIKNKNVVLKTHKIIK